MAKETDHDILIELRVNVKNLGEQMATHLKHHGIWTYACAGAVLSLIVGFILAVVK